MFEPDPLRFRYVTLIISSLCADAPMAWYAQNLAILDRRILREVIRDDMIVFAFGWL